MKKSLRLVKILGGVLFTLILLLLTIPFFISAETLKTQVTEQVKKATGRNLTIAGDASLTLFPNIEVSVQDVTLGNPPGFKTAHLIKAKTLATGAALQPLLAGNLHITGITLDGADIQLEQTAAGAKNWEFASKSAAPAPATKNETASPLKSFALGDVTISDSAVTFTKPGETLKANDINLTVKGADGRGALTVNGGVQYQGKPVKLAATVENLARLTSKDGSAATLALTIPGGDIRFEGTVQQAKAIAASGALDVVMRDIPDTLQWATGKAAGASIPTQLDLNTSIAVQGQKYTFKKTKLEVDGLTATGDITANLEGTVPAISGTLAFGMLDLNKLMKTPQTTARHGWMDAYAAEPAGWSDAAIDLSALKKVNANLTITADALRQGQLEVSNITLRPQLSGGNLTLGIDNASLYGGTAKGTVSASANGGQSVGANLAFSGIQIEPFLTALKQKESNLSGTANLNLNVKGSGASQRAIVSTLNGNGDMRVTDGALKGINLAQFWRDLKGGFLFDSPGKSTDFSELSASFTIASGIVSNQDLAMKSPALRLSGSGTVNLPQRMVNYRLVPSIVATTKGQGGADAKGIDVPVNVTGSIDNPSITPDLASAVQQQLKDPAALKENIKSIEQNIKQFNSPKDIGKALLGGGEPPAPTQPASTPQPAPAVVQPTKEQQLIEGVGGLLKGL